MPKLLSCNPSGYFSYGLHKTIVLDNQGMVLLDGVNEDRGGTANGAGKTALLNAVTQIIFGKNPSGENGESVINEFLGRSFGRVLFLDDHGNKWRITETKKWRKTDKYPDEKLVPGYQEEQSEICIQNNRYSGTDVYLEKWDPINHIWIDERSTNKNVGDTRLDLKATRKKIIDTFGMQYDQFMSVAYLAQQQGIKFINGTHKDRMEVLNDIGGLTEWDNRIKAIKKSIDEMEAEKSALESTISGFRRSGSLIQCPDQSQKTILEQSINKLSLNINDCDNSILELETHKKDWLEAIKTIDDSTDATVKEMRHISVSKDSTKTKLDLLAKDYANRCTEIRDRPQDINISRLNSDISELRGQIQIRRYDMDQLMVGSGKCTRCRSNVSHDHLARQRELLLLEIKELEESVKIKSEELGRLQDTWQNTIKRDLDIESDNFSAAKIDIELAISLMDSMLHALDLKLEGLKTQKNNLGSDPQIAIDITAQKRLLFLSEKTRLDERLKVWADQKQAYDDYKNLVSESESKLADVDSDLQYHYALEKLFGDKGIKAFKLNNILVRLNNVLKEYINIITDGTVSVWVNQYREKKSDKELTADIQIVVNEGQKRNIPFDLYSGGERQQIMLAFIGAFWKIASEYGSGLNVIFLDEVLGPMDNINSDKVFNFFDHLRKVGKNTILIITHNQSIKDRVIFDQIWTAVKKNHISTLIHE